MKVNFPHTVGIIYNFTHNIQKNDGTYLPQQLSYTKNSFLGELNALQNYNLSFLGKTTARPVLAIDREMNYEPYSSANKAGSLLGIATPRILKCIKEDKEERAKYAGDYCFVPLCEVQIVKEDGTVDIDKEKVREIFEAAEIARVEGANVKKHRFYGMNKDKKPIPFESFTVAEKVTSASRSNIIKCLNGTNKTAGGYIFFEPEEIEIVSSDGKIDFDKEKLNTLIKRAEEYLSNPYIGEKTPVYALYIGTSNKEDIRFNTITEAISELKTSHRSINACLSGDKKFAGDYCYAPASEIETIKEDGTVDIDVEKISRLKKEAKIAKENNTSVRGEGIYAFKIKDNSLKRYNISADAAHLLEMSPASISACLAGRIEITGGYIFLPANKVEIEDENGILVPDEEKLKKALKEHHEIATAYRAERIEKRKEAKKTSHSEEKKVTSKKKTKSSVAKNKQDNKDESNFKTAQISLALPSFKLTPKTVSMPAVKPDFEKKIKNSAKADSESKPKETILSSPPPLC